MSKNDGGPAFPIPIAGCTDGGVYNTLEQSKGALGGMTLRDYFAAKAMQGILCQRQPHTHPSYAERETCIRAACEVAFVYADCMLAERAKDQS